MANYIDQEIVCEAYVHLDIDEAVTSEEIERIKNQLKKFFDDRVKFLFGPEVETSIQTADGSLKVTLSAFAGIAALLGGAVLNYSEFRNSVRAIYDDSKMLAEATNFETIFVTRTPSCDRLHAEARTGVIGRTAKLLTAIDTLKAQIQDLRAPATKTNVFSIDQQAKTVTRLGNESVALLGKVTSDENRFCLAKGIYDAMKQLPDALPAELELKNDPLKRSLLKQAQQDLLAIAAFQNYTAAIKGAREALIRIGEASKPKSA